LWIRRASGLAVAGPRMPSDCQVGRVHGALGKQGARAPQ
jgi:hypothetical protein